MFQHVSYNIWSLTTTYVIAVLVQIYLIQDSLYKEDLQFTKKVNLDILMQHVEHDVPRCMQCNI